MQSSHINDKTMQIYHFARFADFLITWDKFPMTQVNCLGLILRVVVCLFVMQLQYVNDIKNYCDLHLGVMRYYNFHVGQYFNQTKTMPSIRKVWVKSFSPKSKTRPSRLFHVSIDVDPTVDMTSQLLRSTSRSIFIYYLLFILVSLVAYALLPMQM